MMTPEYAIEMLERMRNTTDRRGATMTNIIKKLKRVPKWIENEIRFSGVCAKASRSEERRVP